MLIFISILFLPLLVSSDIGENKRNGSRSISIADDNVALQEKIFHWHPYKRTLPKDIENHSFVEECIERPSSIDEFPPGLFTREQRLHGLILVHFFSAIYFFIVLAFVCDKYFLPTVDRICHILKISPDVAATTFMATATTMPEFFTNSISTFVAESDMGLSAIVGSTLFNTLGVCACASMFAKQPIQIDWWPITRDSVLFVLNVIILVIISWDGVIMWWETCILVALYICYWTLMFQNKRIMGFVKSIVEEKFMWCQRIKNFDIENQMPKVVSVPSIQQSHHEGRITHDATKIAVFKEHVENMKSSVEKDEDDEEFKLWQIPRNISKSKLLWYFFTWPIRFLLYYTIPDPDISNIIIPLSFVMCVLWIGSLSYMIFWLVVIVGDTFLIPEPVMGLTFLAFGGCMPEAISAVIVARKGSGEMGVSNALGANCLAILFSLGLPWFIITMLHGAASTNAHIHIYSYGMEYTIMILILAVVTLYSILAFNGYKLRKIVGVYLFVAYFIFVTFTILMEFNVFLVGDC